MEEKLTSSELINKLVVNKLKKYDSEDALRLGKLVKKNGYNYTQVAKYINLLNKELGIQAVGTRSKGIDSIRCAVTNFFNGHVETMNTRTLNMIGDAVQLFLDKCREAEQKMAQELRIRRSSKRHIKKETA